LTDITRPAPPCPECGGERVWYGSVEFWVGGSSHRADDNLNAAVCGNCGYSSLYLQNMQDLRRALASAGMDSPAGDIADAPGALAASRPPDRVEIKAFRKAVRKQMKSKDT
jgi:predicted nucleic-acid-binding Zn-ribbon protein